MPTHQPLNGLSGTLQSSEGWARQQVLELIRLNLAHTLSSLTTSEQRDYVRLQREAHQALKAVEAQNSAIIHAFKTQGLAQLRSRLDGQDPEQIFLHTRYLEKVDPPLPWEPRPSNVDTKPRQKRFRRAYDEWQYRAHVCTLSLWDAACLNFDFATETPQPSGHSFVHASYLTGARDLSVASFVAISRELDLGGQLQQKLHAQMQPGGTLASLLLASTQASLRFEALEAYRNRASTGLTRQYYDALLQTIDATGTALGFDTLGMLIGVDLLQGATVPVPLLLIRVASLGVLSYFPFRPGGALRYHEDAATAGRHFIQQLKDSHAARDLGWFARQLPASELHAFKLLGKQVIRPPGLTAVAGWLYDTFHRWFPASTLDNLRFTADPKHGRDETLVQALTYRQAQRYQANLSSLASARSERDLQAVIDGAANLADEVLQLLLLPMPGGVTGLNRVMQLAVFGSLTYSVITGVNEAVRGQADQFASALADVADMAVNGLLVSTAGRVHQQRIEGLLQQLGNPRKVIDGDGKAMLWKADIGPYVSLDQNLLNGHVANPQGIYEISGKQYAWVRQGEKQWTMEVSYDTRTMRFALKQESPGLFAPPILFDSALQAWVLDLTDTHALSDIQLVERLLPNGMPAVSGTDIQYMLRSLSPSRATLNSVWAGHPAPINLIEGARRLQVDRLLRHMINDFHRLQSMPPYADQVVLRLLPHLPGWPATALIHVHDAQDLRLETYAGAQPAANGTHPVNLTRRDDGTYVGLDTTVTPAQALFEQVLGQLPASATLGKESNPNFTQAQRIARLREQISQQVRTERMPLFAALTRYAEQVRSDVPSTDDARRFVALYRAAPALPVTPLLHKLRTLYPPLTPAHLLQLLALTPLTAAQQALFISDAKLPAPVHESLEHHRTALRIDAAIDGLYNPRPFNPDADLWAREFASSLLRRLLQRPLVVTEIADGKALMPYVSSGPDDLTVELRHYGQGHYEAVDFRNGGTIPVGPPSDSFYLAIASVLQPHERLSLGMRSPVDAQGLRTTLGDTMSAQRSREGYVSLLDHSLGQYEMSQVLPTDLIPNREGLYELNGQNLLSLAGSVYAITFDSKRLMWRLKHPDKVGVDTPLLAHNRYGAWRLANDNPLTWSDHQLFSRLGPGDYNVDQATAQRILALTDTPARALREVHSVGLPPPPLLADTGKRFRIERDILHFIQAMTVFSGNSNARPSLQLLLVTALPEWPASHALQIVDSTGKVVGHYPTTRHADAENIRITQAQSRSVEPLKNILQNDALTQALLGEQPSTPGERLFKLAKKIAQYAYRERAQLFSILYAQSERGGTALQQRFKAHHPALPASAVEAILEQASPREIKRLQDHDEVGLRLAEQARLTLNDARLNRAFEGLYLNTLANPDSDTITLHLLKSVPGWPATLRVDIHEGNAQGRLLQSAGHAGGSDRRTLARLGAGYQAYDSEGRLLNDPADAVHDLLTSLAQVLSVDESQALGIVDGIDTQALQTRIADLALSQRVAIKQLLGLPHIPYWLQPPMQVHSTFTAYPFSLTNLWPFTRDRTADLVSKVIELYPSFNVADAHQLIDSLGMSQPAAFIELESRKAEYQALDFGLTRWAETPQANDANDPMGLNLGRRRFLAQQIRRAWRRQTREAYYEGLFDVHRLVLELDGNDLPDADFMLGTRGFEHIEYLKISGDAFPATGDAFLGKFANLLYLKIDCLLGDIPQSVTAMTQLHLLDLSENSLVLTPQSRQRLAGLTALRGLFLDGNPLGLTPDVSAMGSLEDLSLRNTGIDRWPLGAESRFSLRRLQLQENQITTLPNAVFSDTRMQPANRNTLLHDNPLSADTLARITAYRNTTGIQIGGALPGIVHVHATPTAVNAWLSGVPAPQHEARKALWAQLERHTDPSPDDVFRVLRDLTKAHAFTRDLASRQALTDRVWRLLDAMGQSTQLRHNVFLNTYVAGTCGDGALLTFIDMEIEHKVHQARSQAGSHQADRELLALAEGLFYLREVDRLAGERIETLYEAGVETDDAEIKLYYRLKLRRAFNLPVQDESMLYSVEEWVSERDIAQAREALTELGRTTAAQNSLLMETFWIEYLAHSYPEPFSTIETMARYQLHSLNQQVSDRGSDEYLERRQSIVDQEITERDRLVRQLTEAAQVAVRSA
ncbi:NEL-type E3 ubiquitin ligase domain-containing protein [Pseudomonas sp. SDO528_S397]